MAAYFTGGGTDVETGTDGLQTLYLMNPNYAGYTDGAGAGANMVFLNSAVSFGHHHPTTPSPAAHHFVGIPLQPAAYNLWGHDAAADAADVSTTAAAVSLSSSRQAPPAVTVAASAVIGGGGMEKEERVVMRSKYLKAAQELLEEAVSVGKGVEEAKIATTAVKKMEDSEGGVSGDGGGGEMSTAERQELQMKKSKLLNMLDEVEQRCRKYHRQMHSVAASFEAAAGRGAAATYTAVALRTISRQFRCLRDAIAAQVTAASRGLGEEDGCGDRTTVGLRLNFIDRQLRRQRAMQQLGMVSAAGGGGGGWRPQRGLPERAVSVLRAWLFEHFLHPYPKDSDKVMLANQTGLTRSQVSNWFINARVRLWKPMVEEMYAEVTNHKDDHHAAAGGGGGESKNTGDGVVEAQDKPYGVGIGMSSSPATTTSRAGVNASSSNVLEVAGDQQTPASFYGIKKARTADDDDEAVSHRELLMKFMEAGGGGEGARGHHPDIDGTKNFAFAGHGGGGVSLTLGLPHGADQTTTPASFLVGGGDGGAAVTTAGYDMSMQGTKSLVAQLMRDFVA